jgi:hypothetical protein
MGISGARRPKKEGKDRMVRYCKRTGCGHEESEHTSAGCAAMVPGANVMLHCVCHEFVAVENVRACTCDHPPNLHDHKVGCTADGCPCCWLGQHAKPPSVPPLRVVTLDEQGPLPVRNRSEALERAAACHRTADAKGIGPALAYLAERSPFAAPPQQHTIIDPGAKIMLAGKPREMTELHAAANAIVAETNCEDLATGAFEMRQTILRLSRAIQSLSEKRDEFESFQNAIALILGLPHTTHRNTILAQARDAIRKGATNISVRIDVNGAEQKPGDIAEALRRVVQQFAQTPAINVAEPEREKRAPA